MKNSIQISVLIITLFAASCSLLPEQSMASGTSDQNYKMISVTDFQAVREQEKFTLVNVHIPNVGNIPDTDLEIPFDEIENYADVLPQDKDEKIIVYCLSDSMGHSASTALVEKGYTDVSNLEGGYIAWQQAGFDFEEKK